MKEERNILQNLYTLVYIRTCKMVLWPIRACVLFELFHKTFFLNHDLENGHFLRASIHEKKALN